MAAATTKDNEVKKKRVSLSDRIHHTLVTSVFDKKECQFLPNGSIDNLITRASILRTLRAGRRLTPTDPGNDLVDFIFTEAKKVFAVTVDIDITGEELRKVMELFRQKNISDKDLPLERALWDKKHMLSTRSENEDAIAGGVIDNDDATNNGDDEGGETEDENDVHEPWSEKRIDQFCHNQWKFMAPVFSTTEFNHDLGPLSILPFTEKDIDFDRGAFGRVSKFRIHESHIDQGNGDAPRPEYVAVKEIEPENKQDRQKMVRGWEKEASMLSEMNMLGHDHILRFLTAFRRGYPGEEDHYLMLEWASGGNLRNLWKTLPQPTLTPGLVKAAFHQLVGLASAIHKAHEPGKPPFFRHGDLKPENILWFKDENDPYGIGTLKIGDWGLAKGHKDTTRLRTNKTTTEYGTIRYEPPEEATAEGVGLAAPTQPGKPPKRRSRLYDVWSMGCIFLEFLIWLMYGFDELNEFNQSIRVELPNISPFYEIKHDEHGKPVATVHHVVVKWMNHMANDPRCKVGKTALGNLLELIRDRLLVVKLPPELSSGTNLSAMYDSPEDDLSNNNSLTADALDSLPDEQNIPEIVISEHKLREDPVRRSTELEPVIRPLSQRVSERGLSKEFEDRMVSMSGDGDENYWFAGEPNSPRGPKAEDFPTFVKEGTGYQTKDTTLGKSIATTERTIKSQPLGVASLPVARTERVDYGHTKLDNEWDLHVDNDFAKEVISSIDSKALALPYLAPSSTLCTICQGLRDSLWQPAFSIFYTLQHLKVSSKDGVCELCKLFWRACERRGASDLSNVSFERIGTSLVMNGHGPPIMSIYRSPGLKTRIDLDIQIGFPCLPAADSDTYHEIIRQWLKQCDSSHKDSCCPPPPSRNCSNSSAASQELPTRVVSVGKQGDDKVCLLETDPSDKGEWVALSHQWGTNRQFCTTIANRQDHINGMNFNGLPRTFRDAVTVTRALGCRYLWIDSICIIQGPDGDFNKEAKRMEQVYSGAYCVLASSRSPGHYAGFLEARNERDAIALCQEGESAPFYICQTIDDFKLHVLDGALNRRGWVLQEHALARRTVYFTDHQTYFECGDGVRCETMTRMTNELASFLGDPNFPQIIMRADQGEKILLYQDLYRRYSRLGLSRATDRAMAIDGLQQRILKALKVDGGFGVFSEGNKDGRGSGLLRRSLLWCRGADTTTMCRIQRPSDGIIAVVPSWSWMAYTGGIDYISPPFGGVEWEEIGSPWSPGLKGDASGVQSDKRGGNLALIAEARDYNAQVDPEGQGMIVFDCPGGSQQPATKCIVLGIQKGRAPVEDRLHYLLVVKATTCRDRGGNEVYERVGAGYLSGRLIAGNGLTVSIH